jgi:hypothetical protein
MMFSRRRDRVNFARRLVEEDDMEIVEDQPKVCLTFRKLLRGVFCMLRNTRSKLMRIIYH